MNTTTTRKQRVVSILLALVLVLSMLPASVFAEENTNQAAVTAGGTTTEFATYAQAVAYANAHSGSTLRLLADIKVPDYETPADMPFITGNVTLDLNGKSINYVDVGSAGLDEDDEAVKGQPGTLTVTGSGSIELLTMYYGALTLNGGTVNELRAEDFAATVHITGGTVENFVLSLRWDDKATADISGGSVQKLDLGTGTVNITGGSHGSETAPWGINGGTLNISGGSFSNLRLLVTGGKINLTGGEFEYISTDPQAPSSEYQKLTMGSLLGDNCAFCGKDGSLVSADVLTLENVKIVADHEHTYQDGKCTACGALCRHDRVETAMGKCEVCGVQLEAEVSSEDASPVYYTSFIQAWDALQPNRKDQVTVTLLRPRYDLGNTDLYVSTNNIRLDLNYHVMFGTGKIVVSGDQSTFTVANGELDGITVEAAGGTVTVEDDCNGMKALRVTSTESAVTIRGGNIGKLILPATDTESLKNVKLSGGDFGSISFHGTGNVAITDLLEAGYAFRDNKGVFGDANGLVPYGRMFPAAASFAELEVVKCDHSAVNEAKGYCNYCGKLYEGKITGKDGTVRYVEKLRESDFADGNTVVLLCNITGSTLIPKGDCTIDLNGHSVSQISFIVQDGTLTLKGYGKISVVVLGYKEIDSTLVIKDAAYRNRVKIGVLSVNKTSNTKLTGGQFDKIERKDGRFVEELLAEGCSFFNADWDMPEYIEGKTALNKAYYIAAHEHWFIVNIEGETQCQECGMPCHHKTIGPDGKCQDVCKRQIYVATLTAADGTVTNYESFPDAWTAAAAANDSTLRLLCDVTLDSDDIYDVGDDDGSGADILLSLNSGKFTLDLGGFALKAGASGALLKVSGTADLTIQNGSLINTYRAEGDGQVFRTSGSALAQEGGSVRLIAVNLTGATGAGGVADQLIQANAIYLSDGTLTVSGGEFTGSIAVFRTTQAPVLHISAATLHNGLNYAYIGESREPARLRACFAEGSMLFDKDGKYIDVAVDSYWTLTAIEDISIHSFDYSGEAVVKPHQHSFVDSVCAECDYVCPHDSGKNDREASYFEKAICSLCHCEYGDYLKDTTAPTGEIRIKDRTWWQTALNTISFGLFYKEEVKAEITGTDDSYDQPGFDITKHAVRIEYLISHTALSEETVKDSAFTQYTGAIDLSADDQYVIYARLTDHVGNTAYAGSDGFEIDKTAPAIEVLSPVSKVLDSETTIYKFCTTALVFRAADKNLASVTAENPELLTTDADGNYVLSYKEGSAAQSIVLTDKAGNERRVSVTLYKAHDFDPETAACRNCGVQAAAKVVCGEATEWFASGDELFAALEGETYDGAAVTLLQDTEITTGASIAADLAFDLNGRTLSNSDSAGIKIDGEVTFHSTAGAGDILVPLAVSKGAHLTMGLGIGHVKSFFPMGKLTIYSGEYALLSSMCTGSEAENFTLYGGTYDWLRLQKADVRDVLAKGRWFVNVPYDKATGTSIQKVTVDLCEHANISGNHCANCGMEFTVSVEENGTVHWFDTFARAIHFAKQADGSTVKLLQDITLDETNASSLISGSSIGLNAGSYALDLAGKALDVGGYTLSVADGCDLTILDSAGSGKVTGSGTVDACTGGHLTIAGGDFTGLSCVNSYHWKSLTLKGGSFRRIFSTGGTPMQYLENDCAFALADGSYAKESDVQVEGNTYRIDDVSVVKAPLVITKQPGMAVFYTTSPEKYRRKPAISLACPLDDAPAGQITAVLESSDGSQTFETLNVPAASTMDLTFSLSSFTTPGTDGYRIRLTYKDYEVCSDLFVIAVQVCNHTVKLPVWNMRYDNLCRDCYCALGAFIRKDNTVTGYIAAADAFAAAQTEENRDCTLTLLSDCKETLAVKSGAFTLIVTEGSTMRGNVTVAKGAELTIAGYERRPFGGTANSVIGGKVVCAKGGTLTASKTEFRNTVNCVGTGSFTNVSFWNTVSGKGLNTLTGCTLYSTSALSVSGTTTLLNGTADCTITVNSGGKLTIDSLVCEGSVVAKSGGTLELTDGVYRGEVTAQSGSTFTVGASAIQVAAIEKGANATLKRDARFGNITVGGRLIDCLDEGLALQEIDTAIIIDGRVPIASSVCVVSHPQHTCQWNTGTHEKLCGCGYVEATDTEAPVFDGIADAGIYYGSKAFTVTDENEFTLTIDGETVTLGNGAYTLEPDNASHSLVATDIAGNTASVTVSVMKLYRVTLPMGTGYTVTGAATAGHGTDYEFEVKIADGYSKTRDYKVLVNGEEPTGGMGDESGDTLLISGVSGDLVITVEGVADITPPAAEITVGTSSFRDFLNTVTFGLFFKETQTVTVTASDAGSGVKTVEYLLSETAFAGTDAITGSWTALALTDGKAEFRIAPNQKAFVYVRATDASGNVQVINSEGVVVYTDAEAITETADFTMLEKTDITLDVKLNGNAVAALYNGDTLIDSGNYAVSENGTITLKNSYLYDLAAGEYTIRVQYNPMGEEFRTGDAPAMTSVKLTVHKRMPNIVLNPGKRVYSGTPLKEKEIPFTVAYNGALVCEFKPADADDSAYTATAPKNAGVYTVRLTLTETDRYKAASRTAAFEITPKEVTITGAAVEASRVYNGTTGAVVTAPGTIAGLVEDDDVSILPGTAAYLDRNAGTAKKVAFSGFSLTGPDAANYTLAAQPTDTTAGITAKRLTIVNLKVKDKQYDGTNAATLDGTPTLDGLVEGDTLQLLNGVPTFDSVAVGKGIPVSFTTFALFGDSVMLGNYALVQPTGITADIVEYIADGSEYSVNSNDWINTDFVVTAAPGYAVSLTNTAGGAWTDTLTASTETADGTLAFYVKNLESGAISTVVTEHYKIDKTAPTGEVRLNEHSAFQTVLNQISFGLFFNDDVKAKLSAADEASGVKSVQYHKTDRVLTDAEVRAITDWTEDSDFSIKAKDLEQFILYVRIEDNAGNVGYIGSDGAIFDTTAPEIVGVENGNIYYVTKRVAVDDENLASVTRNGEPVDTVFSLSGDMDAVYVIRATDKAGNETEYTVTMRPIASITDAIAEITPENVKSSDAETVETVERQTLDIAERFDEAESTEDEWNKLLGAAAKCKELQARIAEVTAEIDRLTNGVNGYDIDTVTSDDKADIESLIESIDALLGTDNLTDAERAALEALKEAAQALLDRIAAAKAAAERDEIIAVRDITKDNVTLDDKNALEKAEQALEEALRDFGGNYTEAERDALEAQLVAIKAALAAIANAEKVLEEIGRLPSVDEVKLSDKDEVERVKKLLDGLTENEKAMLGSDAAKVDALLRQLQQLAEESKRAPGTGDANALSLWIALLFLSGSGAACLLAARKKKKHSK